MYRVPVQMDLARQLLNLQENVALLKNLVIINASVRFTFKLVLSVALRSPLRCSGFSCFSMEKLKLSSIAEKCFDMWGILKMATVKSVESGNNSFGINYNIICRSKLLPLELSKFVLVLIL